MAFDYRARLCTRLLARLSYSSFLLPSSWCRLRAGNSPALHFSEPNPSSRVFVPFISRAFSSTKKKIPARSFKAHGEGSGKYSSDSEDFYRVEDKTMNQQLGECIEKIAKLVKNHEPRTTKRAEQLRELIEKIAKFVSNDEPRTTRRLAEIDQEIFNFGSRLNEMLVKLKREDQMASQAPTNKVVEHSLPPNFLRVNEGDTGGDCSSDRQISSTHGHRVSKSILLEVSHFIGVEHIRGLCFQIDDTPVNGTIILSFFRSEDKYELEILVSFDDSDGEECVAVLSITSSKALITEFKGFKFIY